MLKAYDTAVKQLIEVFSNKIPVFGLQNEDTENDDAAITQAGKNSKEDKISLPIISVFRNPEILITDGSKTKRSSTAEGYSWEDSQGNALSLVAMRSTLTYTIDVFDVTRSSTEEIATKLFFRLRNNPQIEANFYFEEIDFAETCIAEIQLGETITHVRLNEKTKAQAYKIRFSFQLVNANIYDLLSREFPNLSYSILVKLDESSLSIK